MLPLATGSGFLSQESPHTMDQPTSPHCSTLLESLQHHATASGIANQTAFTYCEDGERESASITFLELDERARSLAAHLQTLADRGDRILLVYPPGLARSPKLAVFRQWLKDEIARDPQAPPPASPARQRDTSKRGSTR